MYLSLLLIDNPEKLGISGSSYPQTSLLPDRMGVLSWYLVMKSMTNDLWVWTITLVTVVGE